MSGEHIGDHIADEMERRIAAARPAKAPPAVDLGPREITKGGGGAARSPATTDPKFRGGM